MAKKYFDGVKIGDKVWSFVYGWGTVKNIDYTDPQPIAVEGEFLLTEYYSLDGKEGVTYNQTLFWDEFEVPNNIKEMRKNVKS